MEPPAAPNVSVYALAVAALNQSRRPALLVLSTGTLLSSTFQAGAVQAQAADVLAAVRAKGLPLAVLGCGIGSAQLQALLDAHRLGPFRSLACSSAPAAEAAPDLLAGLRQQAGAQFGDMLLLADDPALVRAGNRAGLTAQLVRQGLTAEALRQGLQVFESKQLDDRGF